MLVLSLSGMQSKSGDAMMQRCMASAMDRIAVSGEWRVQFTCGDVATGIATLCEPVSERCVLSIECNERDVPQCRVSVRSVLPACMYFSVHAK